MRDFKGMKRQRGRNRGGGGGSGGGSSGGGKQTHNVNRAFDSNGPDNVKIRGHAQHVYEKYQQLARDASSSGDRVLAENYLQHAEHYFRLIRSLQPQRPPSEIVGRDVFASGYDIDFEDESIPEAVATEEAEAAPPEGEMAQANGEQRGEQRFENRGDYRRDDRGENRQEGRDYNRQDRNDGRSEQRFDGQRRDNRRDERPRNDDRPRNEDRPRNDDRPREDRPRNDDRPRYEGRRDERGPREERYERRDEAPRDPMPVVEPRPTPLPEPVEAAEASPVLRSQDGGVSHAPAFLQSPTAATEEAAPKRPRGRPRRKAAAEGDAPAEAEEA